MINWERKSHHSKGSDGDWENKLRRHASAFQYPPTPDLASRQSSRQVRINVRRNWVTSTAIIAIAFGLTCLFASLTVPEVRATVQNWIQVGVIRLIFGSASSTPTATSQSRFTPSPSTVEPLGTPTVIPSLLDLSGTTTLDEARKTVTFPIRLPTYPRDQAPDFVFVQDQGGDVVILLWMSQVNREIVELALYEIAPTAFGLEKVSPELLSSTIVNGEPAYYLKGPYILRGVNGDIREVRLVSDYALVWEKKGITYRLEADATLEEMVKIAESLYE